MSIVSQGVRILRREGVVEFALRGAGFLVKEVRTQTSKLGSGRVCPVCGFSGRRFAPSAIPTRPECQCPGCDARERHRLLWYYIRNETDLTEGGSDVLYFAPTNDILDELRAHGNDVTTTNLIPGDVDVRGDITRLPFESGSFDVVICNHVLEHVPDDAAAMSELRRVLTPDGEALLMVPKDKERERTYEDDSVTSPEARRREFGREDHVRWYGRDFADRLAESGFDVSTRTYAESLDEETVERYGLQVHDPDSDAVRFEDVHHCVRLDGDTQAGRAADRRTADPAGPTSS